MAKVFAKEVGNNSVESAKKREILPSEIGEK
jgi:hypothetical protein